MDTPTLTAPTATTTPVVDTAVVEAAAVTSDRCQMCEHRAADHDPLARRYCAATAQGALSRGCICR